jgi:PAS domain S-box-containing protein
MTTSVLKTDICNELDVVLAHRHTVQLSELSGIGLSEQTKLATAISEICRNCLEYAGEGILEHEIEERDGHLFLQATISDKGKGIPTNELEDIRANKLGLKNGRGVGIANARKLTDYFELHSDKEGTNVVLGIRINNRNTSITASVIENWRENLKKEKPVSPYEEIKKRNNQLMELTRELEQKNQALQQAHDELHESREGFRFISEHTPQMIWKTDEEGKLEYVNQHFNAYSGLTLEEFQLKGWEYVVHPEDMERTELTWMQSLATGDSFEIEHRLRRADGEFNWHICRAEAMHDAEGRIRMWIGTSTDIDSQKRSAIELESKVQERTEALSRVNEELNRSNQDLEQFAYVASHDLNEPIRMVSNFTKLLSKRYQSKLGQDADDFIGFIAEGAERMQALITDLLTYSRVGRLDAMIKTVDCNEAVRLAISNLHEKIENSGAQILFENLPALPSIGSTLVQLFQNLIDNAIKFRSRECPLIRISARQQKDGWKFTFSDNGIGIDPQYGERIFIIFQRLHTREKYHGTGIGLAICKKIVEYHNGSINVESRHEEGTTFVFTLKNPETGQRRDN